MGNIQNKESCCSCGACSQACPKSCISMAADRLTGFRYPIVESSKCIDCGLCESVCPMLSNKEPRRPIHINSYQNPDRNILLKSSSGGFISAIATSVLTKGGVVFGARFTENWQVEISYTESIEGLESFRGSKYVQASTGSSFIDAQHFLKQGRIVLYSGTPCQIAGLKQFLRKDYENLILVDLICHGVPSPRVWDSYVKEKLRNQQIENIFFRDKSHGWENFSVIVGNYKSVFTSDPYMKLFLSDMDLANCCYHCQFKEGRSGCDYTVGDFWGAGSDFENRQDGIGVVLTYSQKLDFIIEGQSIAYEDALKGNPSLEKSPKTKNGTRLIYSLLAYGVSVSCIQKIMVSRNFFCRCLRKAYQLLNR